MPVGAGCHRHGWCRPVWRLGVGWCQIDPRVKLAYDESLRGLDLQNATLNELHSRTGVVIAAATVASGFLGTSALERHLSAGCLNALALVAFAATILLCLGVLWPSEDWEFAYDASELDERYYARDVDPTAMCRTMLLGNAESRDRNNGKLRMRFRLFRFACGALVCTVLLWLAAAGLH